MNRRSGLIGMTRGAALLALALAALPAWSGVYKYVDANGVTHYTDRKPAGRNYRVLIPDRARSSIGSLDWARVPLNLTDFAMEIDRACAEYGVDAALVRAVIHAESWFDRRAVSRKGAIGLMQLMPDTQQRFGVSNAFDSWENISAGVRYLKILLDQFQGDVRLATAAYNAGENAVKRYGGIPPYAETRTYVQRVSTLRQRYSSAL